MLCGRQGGPEAGHSLQAMLFLGDKFNYSGGNSGMLCISCPPQISYTLQAALKSHRDFSLPETPRKNGRL